MFLTKVLLVTLVAASAFAGVSNDPRAYSDIRTLATLSRAGHLSWLPISEAKKIQSMREYYQRLRHLCVEDERLVKSENSGILVNANATVALTPHDINTERRKAALSQLTSASLRFINNGREMIGRTGSRLLPSQAALEKDPTFKAYKLLLAEPHQLRENIMSVLDALSVEVSQHKFLGCVRILDDFKF